MAPENVTEESRKRKRSQKAKQGPSSTRKRRRADDEMDTDGEEGSYQVDDKKATSKGRGASATSTPAKTPQETSSTPTATPNGSKLDKTEGALPEHSISLTLQARAEAEKPKPKDQKDSSWIVASPVGGRYLSLDPQFTADGKYLVAAKKHEVRLLSVEDSVVQSTISAPEGSTVVGFSVSPAEPQRVYIAFSNPSSIDASRVEQWDWENLAGCTGSTTISGRIVRLGAAVVEETGEEIVYTLATSGHSNHIVRNGKSVFGCGGHVTDMAVFDNTCVCIGPGRLVIGTLHDCGGQEANWDLNVQATCLAVRKRTSGLNKKQKNIAFDLAIGTSTGEIYVYETITLTERGKATGPLPTPRTLHWHREAVQSVKWSRDGNYLISGGRETVLCIWQMVTGKKQFLPHLSAEIEHITISPSGASYALQMADNSIMVLSTSELKPIAHFPDIQAQIPPVNVAKLHEPQSKTSQQLPVNNFRMAGTVHPTDADSLLFAVPPSASAASSSLSRPFLQSFSLSSQRHQYRQALTRNNITDLNTGPNGLPIQSPDISLVALTPDGKTMATVESWTPLPSDFSFLAHDDNLDNSATQSRCEVYLKFWNWDTNNSRWALQTRISNPHPLDSASPGSVLELVSDPTTPRFFTLGTDSTVRTWTHKSSDWISTDSLSLPASPILTTPSSSTLHPPTIASLTISPDASLLATTLASSPTQIHLLSTTTSLSKLCTLPTVSGHVHALSFSTRYLISLSTTSLDIFDIPTLEKKATHPLRSSSSKDKIHLAQRQRHLAVTKEGYVAVAVPCAPVMRKMPPLTMQGIPGAEENEVIQRQAQEEEQRGPWTKIEVLHVERSKRQFETKVQGVVMGLFARGRGWVAITGDGRVVEISPPVDARGTLERIKSRKAVGGEDEVGERGVVEVDAGAAVEEKLGEEEADGDVDMLEGEEGDKPVVRPEALARLFEGRGGNMQVRDMFEGVMGLFARRAVGA